MSNSMKTVLEKVRKNKPRVQKAPKQQSACKVTDLHHSDEAKGGDKAHFWKDWHMPSFKKHKKKKDGTAAEQEPLISDEYPSIN